MSLSIQAAHPLNGQGIVMPAGGFTLRIYVTMGDCGCPIGPGGRLRPEGFHILAEIFNADKLLQSVDMTFSGTASEFTGHVNPLPTGRFLIRVKAHDPETGESGDASWMFMVSPPTSVPAKDTKGGTDAILDH